MKNFMVLSLLLLWGTSCSNEGKVLQMEKWSDVVSGKKADLTDGKLIVSENQKYLYDYYIYYLPYLSYLHIKYYNIFLVISHFV